MTRIFLCIISFVLTACSYQVQKANTSYPNSKYARENAALGLRYLRQGDTNHAMARLQAAFRQNPTDPIVIDATAYFFEKTGEINKANSLYMYALSMGAEQRTANQNYGAFLCRNGYYQESIFYFRQAIRLPNSANTNDADLAMNYCSQKMQHALGDQATWAYYI